MRSFGCAALRAAPFSGSRGAYAPPRETFALCKSKAYSPEAKRSFLPLLASKNCALLQDDGESEICAKSGITRARKTTLFRCAPSSELSAALSHSPTGTMLARALRSSSFSQKSRRWRLRFFVKPRTKYSYRNHSRAQQSHFLQAHPLCRKPSAHGWG